MVTIGYHFLLEGGEKQLKFKYVGLGLLMTFLFIIGANTTEALGNNFINYYGVEMTSEEYQTLLNLGFSDYEINYMEKGIFEENKDLDSELLAQTTKYYKTVYPIYGNSYTVEVTENEYYNHGTATLGQVITAYHTITSSIAANGSLYRYKVTMLWNSIPSVKSYDVIGIGFDDDVEIDGLATFYYMYTNSANNTFTSYNYYHKLYYDYGGTATYKLPTDFIGGGAVYYFDVDKADGAGTITSLEMCGDYAHAHTDVTGPQAASHLIDIIGIDFAGSVINYFDEIPCAESYVGNLNW